MNKYVYRKEIESLKQAVDLIRDTSTMLRDSQSSRDNNQLIADKESDATLLDIAADLIERTLPK